MGIVVYMYVVVVSCVVSGDKVLVLLFATFRVVLSLELPIVLEQTQHNHRLLSIRIRSSSIIYDTTITVSLLQHNNTMRVYQLAFILLIIV